jgi:hypothetical protein
MISIGTYPSLADECASSVGDLTKVSFRFSVAWVEQFFGEAEEGSSLQEHVSRARNACKMRYIVGCAPVCYGIPVHLNQ